MRGMNKTWLTWTVSLLSLLILGAPAFAGEKEKFQQRVRAQIEAEKKGELVFIRSDRLYQAYQRNEVAADGKYRDKWIEVESWVQGVSRDVDGNPYVSLVTDQYGIGEVQARLFPVQLGAMRSKGDFDVISAEKLASQLHKGQHVKVSGRGAGSAFGLPRLDSCVILFVD